jgi:transcription initiation factor IIE alpha subunit
VVLSTFEDPEKILDQAVLEMNDDLTKMRQATAQVCFYYSSICCSAVFFKSAAFYKFLCPVDFPILIP